MDRDGMEITIKAIRNANKMLDALDRWDRIIEVRTGGTLALKVRESINEWRKTLRKIDDKHIMKREGIKIRERVAISTHLGSLLANNNFNDDISIGHAEYKNGPKVRVRKKNFVGSHFTIDITVGYLWDRQVYQKIHTKNDRFSKYICLKATEYKTNASGVRLYVATVFCCHDRKMKEGYIGQSKYGKELCTFNADRAKAIKQATKLAAAALSENLGEPK